MKYLEIWELKIGQKYLCQFYEDSDKLETLKYLGDGEFEDKNDTVAWTLYGDIRYVLEKVE